MNSEPTIAAEDLDPHSWKVLSDAVNGLEEAWRQQTEPDLSAFLIAGPEWLRNRILIELIKVDEECAWKRGIRRTSEAYLNRWPEMAANNETLLELVRAECLTRCVFDEPPTANEICRRFPQLIDRLNLSELAEVAASESKIGNERVGETVNGTRYSTPRSTTYAQDQAEIDSRIGTSMGRYQIRGLLGHGGMGIVYRAWDSQLAREVGLKIPRIDQANSEEIAERFLREATIAASIRHRSICPIYDFGIVEGTHFLVMELLSGHSLDHLIRKGPLAPGRVAAIISKLARGLDCIHDAGLLHRDVSASNVIIDTFGEPVLTDFGLARQADIPTTGPHCSGKPAYMAPEALAGDQRTVDLRTDVFGLGVLFYQLLTGTLPQRAEKTDLALDEVSPLLPPSSFSSSIDKRVEAICLRAMAPHPAKRYQSAAELADALDDYLESAPSPSFSRKFWLTSASMVVVGIVGGMLWRNSREEVSNKSNSTLVDTKMNYFAVEDDLLDEQRAQLKVDLDFMHEEMEGIKNLPSDPTNAQVSEIRHRLVSILRRKLSADLAIKASSLLVKLPWPTVENSSLNEVYWNRTPRLNAPSFPTDAGPSESVGDAGVTHSETQSGDKLDSRKSVHNIHLKSHGSVIVRGRLEEGWDHNTFRLTIDEPDPVEIHLVSLSHGCQVCLIERWEGGNGRSERSNTEATGKDGHKYHQITEVLQKPANWRTFHVGREKGIKNTDGDYLLFIWQADRKSSETVVPKQAG